MTKPEAIEHLEAELRRVQGERDALRTREAELRESEWRFRGLLEAAPDAIVIVDRSGRIVYTNHQTEALFGYGRDELMGQPVEILVPERFRAPHVRHRETYFARPCIRQLGIGLDLYGRRRDGSEFPADISLSPLKSGEGILVTAIVRDITERKRTLEKIARQSAELEQAQELTRLKDHILSAISHEMRTPLSLVVGYAELLQEKYPHEPLIGGILDGGHRLAHHLNNILDYSALLSGTLPLYKTEVDLPEIVQNVRDMLNPELEFKNLRLGIEVDPDTPPIHADSRRITQMLVELVDNARKFTPPGGTVGIRVAPLDDHIELSVWDTGSGISEQDLTRLWEALSQLQLGDAMRRGGLGLGLAIVKKLAELHGGRVGVMSQVGQGSRFSIVLPVGKRSEPSSSPDTP